MGRRRWMMTVFSLTLAVTLTGGGAPRWMPTALAGQAGPRAALAQEEPAAEPLPEEEWGVEVEPGTPSAGEGGQPGGTVEFGPVEVLGAPAETGEGSPEEGPGEEAAPEEVAPEEPSLSEAEPETLEPAPDDENSAEQAPAPEGSAEEEVTPSPEDVARAQRIHDLLDQRDREAMDDMAKMSQKVADEVEPTLTTYRNDVSAIFSDFTRCVLDPLPSDPTTLAAQCAACREKASTEVVNKLQLPWAQMEDRYIKLEADIDARLDQFEGVRDEARLVFGLEPGDPIDQTVNQAVAQRAAVLRAFKPRQFFEESYGKMSPFAVTSALLCPLGDTGALAANCAAHGGPDGAPKTIVL